MPNWLLIGLVTMAGVVAAPVPAAVQAPANRPEVAVLCSRYCFDTLEDVHRHPVGQAFLRGLKAGGYVDGKDVTVDLRASGVGDALSQHASELARRKPAVIVAFYSDAVQTARKATGTVPIVMVAVNDAVEQGIVASLARPGGNVTGVSEPTGQVAVKRLELLKEIVPGLSRVAVLRNPSNPASAPTLLQIEGAAKRFGVAVQHLAARDEADFDAAFAAIGPA